MSKKAVAVSALPDANVVLVTTHRIAASFLIPGSHREVVIKHPHLEDGSRAETRLINIRRGNPARSIGFIPIKPEYVILVLSRLKIMAGMDIAEKKRPQQGKIPARKQFKKSLPSLAVQTKKWKGKEVMHLQLLGK